MHKLPALLLPTDSFDVDQSQVIGRRIAGRSFLLGLSEQLPQDDILPVICLNNADKSKIKSLTSPFIDITKQLNFHDLSSSTLQKLGGLHIPDPGLSRWQILRQGLPPNSFSFTGIIHTLSSLNVIQEIERIFFSPLHSWDALICTSSAGRDVVLNIFDNCRSSFESKFNLKLPTFDSPLLPVIPLAVSDPFHGSTDSRYTRRILSRERLGIPSDAFVILYLGRISFHSKSHPIPLYNSLQRLANEHPDRNIVLLECGHIYNESIRDSFVELRSFFPDINILQIGGLVPATEEQKTLALAAADIFVSLSDNLQETFGISVVEAMAASLPVIVSDWNGYKDLVLNGISGFRIPTKCPSISDTIDPIDLSYGLGIIPYDTMIGLRSMSLIVDHNGLFLALQRFLTFPNLVLSMGAIGRQLWHSKFSWDVVFKQYVSLWDELSNRRQMCVSVSPDHPYPIPTSYPFAHYPSESLLTCLSVRHFPAHNLPPSILNLSMNRFFASYLSCHKLTLLIDRIASLSAIDHDYLYSELGVDSIQCNQVISMLLKLNICTPLP